jgi:hypothetical protein
VALEVPSTWFAACSGVGDVSAPLPCGTCEMLGRKVKAGAVPGGCPNMTGALLSIMALGAVGVAIRPVLGCADA